MNKKRYLTFAVIFIALSVIISLLSRIQSVNSGVLVPFSLFFSSILIFLTNFVPFSVMEIGIIVFLVFVLVYFVYKLIKRKLYFKEFLIKGFLFISVVSFIFTVTFGIFYNNNSFYESDKDITNEQLYLAAIKLTELCNKYVNSKEENFNKISKDVENAFKAANEKPFNHIVPRPKASVFSEFMSYSYISGMHIPFTGETLINSKMPLYTIPYSMAHETAHSMSIAREDEANFAAFYVLINYGSNYLKFSASAECLSYFFDTLYNNDIKLYQKVVNKLDPKVIKKYEELNTFLLKYKGKTNEIAEKINDTYLKSNGQESGTASYSEVVIQLTNYIENTF